MSVLSVRVSRIHPKHQKKQMFLAQTRRSLRESTNIDPALKKNLFRALGTVPSDEKLVGFLVAVKLNPQDILDQLRFFGDHSTSLEDVKKSYANEEKVYIGWSKRNHEDKTFDKKRGYSIAYERAIKLAIRPRQNGQRTKDVVQEEMKQYDILVQEFKAKNNNNEHCLNWANAPKKPDLSDYDKLFGKKGIPRSYKSEISKFKKRIMEKFEVSEDKIVV